MIHDFYHNTREEIKELEARILNLDTSMQDEESKHRASISSHMQKVKHLEYEHQNSCDVVKSDATEEMKVEREHHLKTEDTNLNSKSELKSAYSRDDMANISDINDKERECKQNVVDLETDLENQKQFLIENNETKLVKLREELTLRMKVEIHEIEERKNEHINLLMTNHEKAFREMKQYYNDITRENLELIKVHKEKLTEIKEKIASNVVLVGEMKQEYHKLKPLLD